MFRTILVPLDGSMFGEHALPFALSIARRAGATVQLAHVHVPIVHVSGISVLDSGADQKAKEQECAYLDKAARRWTANAPDVPLKTMLLEGLTPDALREQVVEGKVDLVVMTTHGRGPLSRWWLGSVADALVRTSCVPLLVVRPVDQPPEAAVAPPFGHILVPLDGSPLAEQALAPVLELGRLMQSRYTLLRVVKPAVSMGYSREWPSEMAVDETMTRMLTEQAESYVEGVARRLREQGLAVQTHVALNLQPAAAILEVTQDKEANLIGLATHGHGGFQRFLLGSVADKVLRGATTPALLYRPTTET